MHLSIYLAYNQGNIEYLLLKSESVSESFLHPCFVRDIEVDARFGVQIDDTSMWGVFFCRFVVMLC